MKRNSDGILCNDKWWGNDGAELKRFSMFDVLKEAIRLITGDEAKNIQVERGDEPAVSYQSENGDWFVMMVYDMDETYESKERE